MTDTIIPRPGQDDNGFLGGPSDAMREIFEHTLQEIMQLEFDQHVGAGRYARNGERLDRRNGTRQNSLKALLRIAKDGNKVGESVSRTEDFCEHRAVFKTSNSVSCAWCLNCM